MDTQQQHIEADWRKVVAPSGPWRERWYGSGLDRGWSILEGRELIAFLGPDVPSEMVHDIVHCHNVRVAQAAVLAENMLKPFYGRGN